MPHTTGYIYFAFKTEDAKLSKDVFDREITLAPTKFEMMFERGNVPRCTIWEFRSKEIAGQTFGNEISELVKDLLLHRDDFLNFKKNHPEVQAVLEVVIKMGHEAPGLSLSKPVIEFMAQLDGTIDCDIFPQD